MTILITILYVQSVHADKRFYISPNHVYTIEENNYPTFQIYTFHNLINIQVTVGKQITMRQYTIDETQERDTFLAFFLMKYTKPAMQ